MSLTDLNLLYNSYLASMKSSSWKNQPQKFENDFYSEIIKIANEIETRDYKPEKGSEFILHERGKIRHIFGSTMKDRVIRHALCDGELNDTLKPYLIYNNGASQVGKGISFQRKQLEKDLHNFYLKYYTNEGYIGFIDFSKFYDNIPHDKIREMILPKLSQEAQWLFDEILKTFEVDVSYMTDEEYANCMNVKFDSIWYYENVPNSAKTGEKMMKKGVNIGDQISQTIGIYYPTPIDNYVKIVRGCKFYGRYMDDMYIICRSKEELQSIIDGIYVIAKELGLFINPKKTYMKKLNENFKYLQIKYTLTDTGKVIKRINPKSVTRERRKIKAYKRLLDKGIISYEDIENAVRSWMGDYSRIMSKQQIKHMKQLYYDLFKKELIWKRSLYLKMEQKS